MRSGVGSPGSEGAGFAGAGAGKFSEVDRDEIAVQFVRVRDELADIRAEPGTSSKLLSRWADVASTAPSTPSRTTTARASRCESRPSLEYYRRSDEIDLLLPI